MTQYRDDREALRWNLEVAENRARAAEEELRRIAQGQPALATLSGDAWFTIARVLLWLQFAGWIVFVLVSFPAYIAIAHDEPPFGHGLDPTLQGILMALVVDAVFTPIGLCAGIAARGLGKGRRWAWVLGIVAAVLGMCFCTPVGVLVLIALLRDRVRLAFYPPTTAQPSPAGPGSG